MANELIAPITPVQLGTSETTILDLTAAADESKRYRVTLYISNTDTGGTAHDVTFYRYEDGDAAADDTVFLWRAHSIPVDEGRIINLYLFGNWKLTGLADTSTGITVQADIVQI